MQTTVFNLNLLQFHFIPILKKNNLFLDRDGIINKAIIRNKEISSPRSYEEFILYEDLKILNDSLIENNFNKIVISNQPDIERGTIDLELIKKINQLIYKEINVNSIYICPHTNDKMCKCRKPNTGLIEEYFKKYQRLGKNFFIGDTIKDLKCSKTLSIPFILRKTQYNKNLVNCSDFAIDSLNDLKNIFYNNL